MPLLRNADIAVPEWCSLTEAYLWVARDVLPMGDGSDAMLWAYPPDLINICPLSLYQLRLKLMDGGIPAQGFSVDSEGFVNREPCEIPFIDSTDLKIEFNGCVFISYEGGYSSEFVSVVVDTEKLLLVFQSTGGHGAAHLPGRNNPVPAKNVGGRPRVWDWEGAINAVWGKIYSGDFSPGSGQAGIRSARIEAGRFMRGWFEQNSATRNAPDDRDIRSRVASIFDVIDALG